MVEEGRTEADGEPQEQAQEGEADLASEHAEVSVQQLLAERDEYLDRWKRAQADYKNLRRRTLADIESAVRHSMQSLLEQLLVVMDHLELALKTPVTQEESRTLARGVQMIQSQLAQVFEREGVQPIPETGQLDPRLHEAVATVQNASLKPGTIVDTVRRGYTWKDVVLRPAQVRAAAPETTPDEAEA